jgi:hypothetical protein
MLVCNQLQRKHKFTQAEQEDTMKTQATMMETVKTSYLVLVLSILGVFAFISAVLIAWPALSYIGAKLFN